MVKEIIFTTFAAIIMTLVVIMIKRLLKILNDLLVIKKAEAEAAGNKNAATAYDMAIAVLNSVTETTVSRIEATQASAVRKAVKNGRAAFTELTKCSDEAYDDILAQLSPYVMASLETCVQNTEKLIRNKIEEVLPKVKSEYRSLEDKEENELPWETSTEETCNGNL